jgi:signal transduction histidine kinase
VRAVAESHGGSVGFDSASERGTTFVIDLPMDARPFLDAPTLARGPA